MGHQRDGLAAIRAAVCVRPTFDAMRPGSAEPAAVAPSTYRRERDAGVFDSVLGPRIAPRLMSALV